MTAPTLKPCPFCSTRGRHLTVEDCGGEPPWFIRCENCGATGPDLRPGVDTDGNYTRREAIEAWNTRSER
jgi:Lar family restriction alleviation protein